MRLSFLLGLLACALCLAAAEASFASEATAIPETADAAQKAAAPDYATRQSRFSEMIDRGGTLVRLVLLLAMAIVWRMDRKRDGSGSALSPPQRRIALGGIGILALATSQNFFAFPHQHGYHTHEMYHYYTGAKYFPELGYYDLYRCSAAAIMENHPKLQPDSYRIRDLRSHQQVVAATIAPRGPRCDSAFDTARWAAFRRDIEWFGQELGARRMLLALRDYGYNPSPVWTLFGRPLASLVPAEYFPIVILSRLDLLLLAASFGAIGWAFGVEGFALAAVAFGANPLSRFVWIGDSFLRYGWFASCLMGLALLRRERAASAGVLLTLSSLLRLFPAFFFMGAAIEAGRRAVRERRLPVDARRFLAGAAASGILLLSVAPMVSGRGFAAYTEFAENMSRYSQALYWNSVGLRPLFAYTAEPPEPEWVNGRLVETETGHEAMRQAAFERRRPVYLGLVALGLFLFWRATGPNRCRTWEAATLGFPLVVLLASPPAYYLCCVVPVALLATTRPRLVPALLVALGCWCVGSLAFYETPQGYAIASVVAVALAFATLWEAGLSRETAAESR